MKFSRTILIAFLAIALFILVAFGILGSRDAEIFGVLGIHTRHYLAQPIFSLGGLPITTFFLLKAAIFLLALAIFSHFVLVLFQKKLLKHTPLAEAQQYVTARVVSYLVFLFGLIIGLQSLGVNLNSLVVIGGALGIGVGLGLQAVVANFVAGLILLLEQPIKLGDRIQVGSTYGDVIRMRGRSTWVRTNDNVVIIIPNSEFINSTVTNWTANDRQVRISLSFGVSYGCDPKVVRDVTLAVAREHPDVLQEPGPEVIFTEFGDSSLNFELRVWTQQQIQTPSRLKSDLYFSIFEAFGKQSIEVPFPQRDLHVRSISPELASMVASLKNKGPA